MAAIAEVLLLHEDVFYEYFKPYRHPKAHHNIWGGHGLETFGRPRELAAVEVEDARVVAAGVPPLHQ